MNNWHEDLCVYQIYPRSFCDSNGDGIGDLRGIISKLDYIKSLGVNAVWLSPVYASPNADYGYDISDYLAINPEFGSMEDFDEMLDGFHQRGIRVIMDLVINHTSSEHEWFKQSRSSVDNPYRDYYYWRKGKGSNPPNNWTGFFGEGAWQYDENTDMWYMHLFAKNQPDLNYGNPKLMEEIKSILRYWLDKGIDGFRCDVITLLSKTEGLPDGKKRIALTGSEHYIDGPRIHDLLLEIKRDVFDKYDIYTVGESVMIDIEKGLSYIQRGERQQLDSIFAFDHMNADNRLGVKYIVKRFNLLDLKRALGSWQTELYGKALNTVYLENHDQPRIVGRYCDDGELRERGAKLLATMEMALSGAVYIYQGQEIAMTSPRMKDLDDYRDVECKNMFNLMHKRLHLPKGWVMKRIRYASRDNARTPMQWTDGQNAGFSTAEPWIKLNPNYKVVNVAEQLERKSGVLNYYKRLIELRKNDDSLRKGEYREYYKKSKKLYVFEKVYEGRRVLTVLNFSKKHTDFRLPDDFATNKLKVLVSNYEYPPIHLTHFQLKPYEAIVYELSQT